MIYRKKNTNSTNKKVRNATIMVVDGIIFKSKLEVYCYKKLLESELDFNYEKDKFILMDKFTFDNKSYEVTGKNKEFKEQSSSIRQLTYTPDFVNHKHKWIIECKGQKTDAFKLKWKLFKRYLNDNHLDFTLYMPRNQKQIDLVVDLIKQLND